LLRGDADILVAGPGAEGQSPAATAAAAAAAADADAEDETLPSQTSSANLLADGRGLHWFTSQLNLSRHKIHPTHPLTPPDTP
jgi:hypothetical protein